MNKKENRMAVRQTVEKAVIRDEQNRRIQSAATNPVKEVLKILHIKIVYDYDYGQHFFTFNPPFFTTLSVLFVLPLLFFLISYKHSFWFCLAFETIVWKPPKPQL